MSADAWSCPHCGDLNVDAEAGEFRYLGSGQQDNTAYFATPIESGYFATPMRPWSFADVQTDNTIPTVAEKGIPQAVHIEQDRPTLAERPPDVLAPMPLQHAAPTARVYQQTQPAIQPQSSPDVQTPVEHHYAHLPGTRQDVESMPAGRVHDEVLRLRPRDAFYRGDSPAYTPTGWEYPGSPPTKARGQAGNKAIAPLLELLGYVGLLGLGHIYVGRIRTGLWLMVGWWIWFGVSTALSALSHGSLDPLLRTFGIAAPIISAIWLWAMPNNKSNPPAA